MSSDAPDPSGGAEQAPVLEPQTDDPEAVEEDGEFDGSAAGSPAAAAAAVARGEEPAEKDYFALRLDGLHTVRARLSLSADVVADVVDEAVAKFLLARSKRVIEPRTALAYFREIVRNEAIDRLRRRTAEPVGDFNDTIPDGDDAVARIVDANASATIVEQLLREAAEANDYTVTRVLNAFLNLAEAKGRQPSSREVGGAAQVSHRTVQLVLKRLREHLDTETSD